MASAIITRAVLPGLAAGAAATAQPEYRCTVVDAFASNYGLRETYLRDINDAGTACGTTIIQRGPNIGYTGFFWTPAGGKTAIDLSWPRSISNTGLIGGTLAIFDLGTGRTTPMPLLPSTWPPLEILGVNDAGVGVGYVQTCNCSNSQGFLQKPYVWDAVNGPRSLPVPGANGAARINNRGQVVGWLGGNGMSDGFVYDLGTNQHLLVSSLFPAPNVKTTATDISDDGVVTGWRLNANGSTATGYTWSPGGGLTLLPFPPPEFQPYVCPSGINGSGVVVGSIYTLLASQRAFVFKPGRGVRDLNTLTAAPGFTLMAATAVNNRGWIVGFGYGGGGMYKAFVLEPLDQPCDPDCDTGTGPGVLDIFDFLCFQNRYAAGSAYACDCDTSTGGGVCDVFDFLCFQNEYAAGCP